MFIIKIISIIKMSILPKVIHRFIAICIKIPMEFTTKQFENLCGATKDPPKAKAIQRKRTKAGGITISDENHVMKLTAIRTVWYWHKNRHINGKALRAHK